MKDKSSRSGELAVSSSSAGLRASDADRDQVANLLMPSPGIDLCDAKFEREVTEAALVQQGTQGGPQADRETLSRRRDGALYRTQRAV